MRNDWIEDRQRQAASVDNRRQFPVALLECRNQTALATVHGPGIRLCVDTTSQNIAVDTENQVIIEILHLRYKEERSEESKSTVIKVKIIEKTEKSHENRQEVEVEWGMICVSLECQSRSGGEMGQERRREKIGHEVEGDGGT